MKNRITLFIISIAICVFTLSGFINASKENTEEEYKINWVSIEEAEELQKKEDRPIYIDVYTTWCGPCKMMSAKTFTNKKVIEIMNSKFYAVKFDAESNKTINFNHKEYMSPGRNHSFTSFLQVRAFPTSVFIDSDLNIITSVAGYFTPKEFIPMLEYIGNNHYKTTSWKDYTNQ
jgi:thioredoxin-related protein